MKVQNKKDDRDMPLPTLLFTPGDPAGIGPDLALKLIKSNENQKNSATDAANVVIVADARYLQQRAAETNVNISIETSEDIASFDFNRPDTLFVYPVQDENYQTITAGKPDTRYCPYILKTLQTAVDLCQSHQADGMVTGPVNKALINDYGIKFSGHTEFLAEATNTAQTVMMLANSTVRVCLATTHLPLKDVAGAITQQKLESVLDIILHSFENLYQHKNTSIGVLGLNPHAGENGHIGDEEVNIIIPVLEQFRNRGFRIHGPLSADTAFCQPTLGETDLYLAMYHDQGLPIVKYTGFGDTINVTLGLPIIRTSVDHGTAYSLAATDKIDPGSMFAAIQHAAMFSKITKQNRPAEM